MRSVQILVIGGGASGMMAAITAARAGGKVLLIEKMNRLGKKILATGNGKCNFTNSYQDRACYRGEDGEFAWNALRDFDHQMTLKTFHEMGILPRERDGYFYPASGQAVSVLEALTRQIKEYKVEVRCGEKVVSLEALQNEAEMSLAGRTDSDGENTSRPSSRQPMYVVTTFQGKYLAQRVILAVGGKAAPIHGTEGDGYAMAERLGLSVIPPLPALTSCVLKGDFMKGWTGVRVQGRIAVYGKASGLLAEDTGELQMVAYGISGIPVFQISRYVAKALEQGDKPYFIMDIMTEHTQQELWEELWDRKKNFSHWTSLDALDGMLHRKLAEVLLHSLGMNPKQPAGQWQESQIQRMAKRMKEWKLGIEAVSGFDKAQITCGGVETGQVDCHTMETVRYPGLYVTGELLDVDGICGGYNLQWAWTSGYLAGKAAAKRHC